MLHPTTHRRRRLAEGLARAASVVAVAVTLLTAVTACAERRDPTVAPQLVAPSESGIRTEQSIVYREVDGQSIAMDACLPAATDPAEPAGAVILLHGGGFSAGARSDEAIANMCVWLAENGYAAFPTSYRLAPKSIYPSQVDDVSAAVEFLRAPEQAARFHIDPARIGVLGSSAGAILALELATSGEGPTSTGHRIAAAVSLSGVADMTSSAIDLGTPSPEAVTIILTYLGCTSIATCDGVAASPISHVDATDPPTLLVNAENDLVPVEQAQAMADALSGAGVANRLLVVPGAGHGSSVMNQDVRTAILDLFGQYLQAPAPSP